MLTAEENRRKTAPTAIRADIQEHITWLRKRLKGVDKGAERLMEVRKKQVNEYMHRLEVAGLGERRDRMNPFFRSLLDPPRN